MEYIHTHGYNCAEVPAAGIAFCRFLASILASLLHLGGTHHLGVDISPLPLADTPRSVVL
jgi:hypothetical protein